MRRYRFGEFELCAQSGFLWQNGAEVAMQPQVLGLLVYLVEHRDRIVSKDELVEVLWEGRAVSDAVLNTRLRDVRRALGDDGKGQRFVRTFPKRGMQFVAEVTEAPDVSTASSATAETAPDTGRRWTAGRIGIALAGVTLLLALGFFALRPWAPGGSAPELALPDRPSIAVLKFSSGAQEDLGFMSDGLAEELIADLSQFKELFVISRNTSFTFDPETADPRTVGRALGVEFVARGSIRSTGDGVRVTAELVHTETGEAVWTERFDRPVRDIFAIQDEISDAISARVLPEMVKVRAEKTGGAPTDDLSAWDLFVQAKAHQTTFSRDGQERAISLARAALDRDPGLAAAHSLIAQARGNLFFWSDGEIRQRDEAIAEAQNALATDQNDPMAHAALGYVYRFTGEEERAIGYLERAAVLNPNSALIRLQLAHTLDWFRHQERALPEIERAIRLSPRDPLLQNMLFYKAHILYHLKRYEASLEATDAMGAVVSSPPWTVFYHLMRAAALAELDRDTEAKAAIDAAIALNPELSLAAMKARFDRSKNHPENRSIWLASLKKAGLPW